jgi:predicted nucleotidyltransferase
MTIKIEDKYLDQSGWTSQQIREELGLLLLKRGVLSLAQANDLAQTDLAAVQYRKRLEYQNTIRHHDVPIAVKQTVQQHFPTANIVLYGSKARGEDNTNSDWDFLIVLEENLKTQQQAKLREALHRLEIDTFLGEVISTIIRQCDEWDNLANTPLYKEIEKDGIVI